MLFTLFASEVIELSLSNGNKQYVVSTYVVDICHNF